MLMILRTYMLLTTEIVSAMLFFRHFLYTKDIHQMIGFGILWVVTSIATSKH